MQKPNSSVALDWNWDGITYDAKASNVRVIDKNHNIRGPNIVFEEEYL